MYIKIKKAELVPDKFGKQIHITMVGLYEDEGKFIKWIKLEEAFPYFLLAEIPVNKITTKQ